MGMSDAELHDWASEPELLDAIAVAIEERGAGRHSFDSEAWRRVARRMPAGAAAALRALLAHPWSYPALIRIALLFPDWLVDGAHQALVEQLRWAHEIEDRFGGSSECAVANARSYARLAWAYFDALSQPRGGRPRGT